MKGWTFNMLQDNYNAKNEPGGDQLSRWALRYAGSGWSIIPCKPDKSPYTKQGKDDATTDLDQVREWWARWPDALIGVSCRASGLLVIDIDNKNGKDGSRSWGELCEAYNGGELPDIGVIAKTMSGGYHLYFIHPQEGIISSVDKLGAGLDLRSKAYVIAPPSPGYFWIDGHTPHQEFTSLPDWLLQAILDLQKSPEFENNDYSLIAHNGTGAGDYWLEKYANKAYVGRRGKTAYEMGLQLSWSNVPPAEAENIALAYAAKVPQGGKFNENEALTSVRSAYKAPKREPAVLPGITHERTNGNYSISPNQDGEDASPPRPAAPETSKKTKGRSKHIKGAEYVGYLKKVGYEFRLCDLDNSLWVNSERMTDALEAEIKTKLRDGGYPKVNVAADAYLAHALKHSFHPVKDYLASLQWDGRDHIGDLATYITDKHDNFPLILRKWLIGAVARPMTGGKQNRVMVIEGYQEIGKSYFARWIGSPLEDYFSEAPPDPDNKDSRLALATNWIWELKELGSITRRADREALKAWLTLETISERPPFGKHPIYKPAMTSFIATVNDEGGFFNDPTGSRRYMTAAVNSIDWDYAKNIDIDQVWAQAFHLFESGENWNLTPQEKARIEAVNDEYEFTPPVYDWLDIFIESAPGEFTLSDDILQAMKAAGVNGSDIHLSRQISGWMKRRGYQDDRQYVDVYVEDKTGQRKKVNKRLRGYHGVELTKKALDFTGPAK